MHGQEFNKKPVPTDDREVNLDEWDDVVADHYRVPKSLMKAMAAQESGGNVDAVSPTGVRGKYQVTERVAKGYGLDRNDPWQQSVAAARYLRDQYDALRDVKDDDERWLGAVGRYYGGPSAVRGGELSGESVDRVSTPARHVESVAQRWGELRRQEGGYYSQQSATPRPVEKPERPIPAPKLERVSKPSTARRLGLKPAEGMSFDLSGRAAAREQYYKQPLYEQAGQEIAGGLARVGESAQRAANRLIRPMAEAVGFGEQIQRGREAEAATAQKLAREEEIANRLRSKVVRGAAQGAGSAAILAPVAMAGGIPAVTGAVGLQQDWERDPLGSAVTTATAGLPIVVGRKISPLAQRAVAPLASSLARKMGQVGIEAAVGGAANVGQYAGTQALLGREIDPEEAIAQGIVGAGLSGAMTPKLTARPRSAPVSRPGEGGTEIINLQGRPQGPTPSIGAPIPRPTRLTRLTPESMRQAGQIAERAAPTLERAPQIAEEQRLQSAAARLPDFIEEASALGPRPTDEMGALDYDIRLAQIQDRYGLSEADVQGISERGITPDIALPRQVGTPIQDRLAGRTPGLTEPLTEPLPESREGYARRKLAEIQARQPVRPTDIIPQPDAPETSLIPQPDAAPTQRAPQPDTGERLIERTRGNAEGFIEQGQFDQAITELQANQRALRDQKARAMREAKNAPGRRVQTREEIGGFFDEMARQEAPAPAAPPRPPTERLPVPRAATDENVTDLRARQEELGRLAYDRRGEFPSDLRDEYNQLNAVIREYDIGQERARRGGMIEEAPPPGTRAERMVPPTAEIEPRRRALNPRERFSSREDERRGYFDTLTDDELVAEVGRLEEERNKGIRGASKLSPEEQRANDLDLRIAVEMQKERLRIQRAQGREAAQRIAPRTPGRKHSQQEAPLEKPPEEERARRLPDDWQQIAPQARRAWALENAPGWLSMTPQQQRDWLNQAWSETFKPEPEKSIWERWNESAAEWAKASSVPQRTPPPLQASPEAARKINHSKFGEVTESPDQSGVRKGQLRVVDVEGKPHVIRNPRTRGGGNREAAFVKGEAPPKPKINWAIPAEAMPELRRPDAPPSPLERSRQKPKLVQDAEQRLREIERKVSASEIGNLFDVMSRSVAKTGAPGTGMERTRGGGVNVVARDADGAPIGVLSIELDGKGKPTSFNIAVKPSMRRQGVATRMFGFAEREGYDLESISGRSGYTQEGANFALSRLRGSLDPTARTDEGARRARQSVKDSPEFKRFFRGSKVVNEQGDPRIVYHGTAAEDFSEFKREGFRSVATGYGNYFTENQDIASSYAAKQGARGRVIPAYLAIKNPLIYDAPVPADLKQAAEKLGIKVSASDRAGRVYGDIRRALQREIEPGQLERLADPNVEGPDVQAQKRATGILKRLGYDGIMYETGPMDKSYREWVAFYPEQIKSATGNRGTFDPKSGNIIESRGTVSVPPIPPQATLRDVSESLRIEYRPAANRAPSVFVNNWAHGFFNDAMESIAPNSQRIGGATNIDSDFAREIAEFAQYQVDNNTNLTDAGRARFQAFADAFSKAADDGPSVSIVPLWQRSVKATEAKRAAGRRAVSPARVEAGRQDVGLARALVGGGLAERKFRPVLKTDISRTKKGVRHEGTHFYQTAINPDVYNLTTRDWLDAQPSGSDIRAELSRRGYTPDQHTAEAAAFVASGEWGIFGMKPDDAKAFLKEYFDNVAFKNGRAALNNFRAVHPALQDVVEVYRDPNQRRFGEGYAGQAPQPGGSNRVPRNALQEQGREGAGGGAGASREARRGGPSLQGREAGRIPGSGGAPRDAARALEMLRRGRAGQAPSGAATGAPPARLPAQSTEQTFRQEALSNIGSALTLPRALMASADLSAPLRQGAILTLPPTQWGRAARSGLRMIQALSTSQYNKLANEMNSHPDAAVGKEAGLYMSTDPKAAESLTGREEDFISRWAGKIPIVKHSEQAYKTYLDSVRLETFRRYKRAIDGSAKLSVEERRDAYKAAAKWINTASGRGSLGETFDKAMPALSTIFFAPRYTTSRMQVLNPATYLKNSTTPAGRTVLKQQMSDMVQFAGVVGATLALAQAAGANVGTDPDDPDFLKIKIGQTRYDALAGLQQPMRFFYRISKDAARAVQGQEAAKGEGALEIAGRFARGKLAPIPSYFTDMLKRRTFTGERFSAGRGAIDRVTPLMWKDMVEAYMKEGGKGAAKMAPGLIGVGVQNYELRQKQRSRRTPQQVR